MAFFQEEENDDAEGQRNNEKSRAELLLCLAAMTARASLEVGGFSGEPCVGVAVGNGLWVFVCVVCVVRRPELCDCDGCSGEGGGREEARGRRRRERPVLCCFCHIAFTPLFFPPCAFQAGQFFCPLATLYLYALPHCLLSSVSVLVTGD